MSSHDKRWCIERYPNHNDEGELENFSYGCPDLNLMGYHILGELFDDIQVEIIKKETEE